MREWAICYGEALAWVLGTFAAMVVYRYAVIALYEGCGGCGQLFVVVTGLLAIVFCVANLIYGNRAGRREK